MKVGAALYFTIPTSSRRWWRQPKGPKQRGKQPSWKERGERGGVELSIRASARSEHKNSFKSQMLGGQHAPSRSLRRARASCAHAHTHAHAARTHAMRGPGACSYQVRPCSKGLARKNNTILSKNIFILPTRPLELRQFTALVWALGLPSSPPACGWNREIERRADFQLAPRFFYHPA